MALNCNTKHPLKYDGTGQHQRFIEALEPSSVNVHGFTLRDWMHFAFDFAGKLRYFHLSDDQKHAGNWQAFLKSANEIEAFLKDAALVEDESWLTDEEREKILQKPPKGNYEPHLALFLSFLKLMKFSQKQMNQLGKRHMDFYFKQVLQLSVKPAVPNRVHLIFELAKNAVNDILPKGTLFDGGKDKNGKPILYATTEELVVGKAKVASLKSIYHEAGKTIRYAEETNSLDGLGTEFGDENPQWNVFGNKRWPVASPGFALASNVLLLKEGKRKVTVDITLAENTFPTDFPDIETVQSGILPLFSGEEEWMEPSDFEVTHTPSSGNRKLSLTISLDAAADAVVPYDPEIHEERFNTNLPILRILMDTGSDNGYAIYTALKEAVVTEVNMGVEVSDIRDLKLENDMGRLDGSKPFYPFGTIPKQGSSFYVGSAEIFQKNWNEIKLDIAWKNKPVSLEAHYAAYKGTRVPTVDGDGYFTVKARYIKNNQWFPTGISAASHPLFSDTPAKGNLTIGRDASDTGVRLSLLASPLLMKKGVDINKAVLKNYLTKPTGEQETQKAFFLKPVSAIFNVARFNPGFRRPLFKADSFGPATKDNFLRLTLDRGFLHEHYPECYSLAMIEKAKNGDETDIPNAPYTPEIASLSVGYTATAGNKITFDSDSSPEDKFNNYKDRVIQLFHEHPFGQNEQHIFLKEQVHFLDGEAKRNIRLLPVYAHEGELYIGLENGRPSDVVSLLIQAVEGSEDPLAPTFTGNRQIEWFALVNNEWQPLQNQFITQNTTNNFLRAGMVKIQLPAGVNTSNTLLDKGFHWIKAQLPEGLTHLSVCEISGIYAQAAEAVFTDRRNELLHPEEAVPAGTIGKFLEKPPLIKAVDQPHASFGGAAEEKDQMFYTRISERLRHKNRAVNLWDYERIVLEKFPSVYKVKCLNHTSNILEDGTPDYFEINPGFVSLIVIPDIRNQDSFDPLKPRASRQLLSEIQKHVSTLHSMHVHFDTCNPDYETIMLDFRIKFHDGYDPNAYLNILNDDLVRHLSPWAFGEHSEISFGGSLYKSVMIGFIENLPYVDFISQVRMYHRQEENDDNTDDLNVVAATSARAILVSARNHKITLIDNDEICHE
ncbi:MAG: hypothetical protein EA394_10875 [Bacteroidia bacterium]|nr:MAG: hypothetical protein EA394_10875 [Bacteroidia bacterium]